MSLYFRTILLSDFPAIGTIQTVHHTNSQYQLLCWIMPLSCHDLVFTVVCAHYFQYVRIFSDYWAFCFSTIGLLDHADIELSLPRSVVHAAMCDLNWGPESALMRIGGCVNFFEHDESMLLPRPKTNALQDFFLFLFVVFPTYMSMYTPLDEPVRTNKLHTSIKVI